VLDVSNIAAAVVAVADESHAHTVAALSDKALSLSRAARAILQVHAVEVSGADARAPLHVVAAAVAASHAQVGAADASDASAAVAAASSAFGTVDENLSSVAEVGSDYTNSHIVPTSEQDLLHYLCGRTIAQTLAEGAHPPVAGQGGLATCIARREKDTAPELNGDKVLAAYYAAAGGGRVAVLAGLDQVRRSGTYTNLSRDRFPPYREHAHTTNTITTTITNLAS
jgi:hypothetical protein